MITENHKYKTNSHNLRKLFDTVKFKLKRTRALAWGRYYQLKFWFQTWILLILAAVLVFVFTASIFFLPKLKEILNATASREVKLFSSHDVELFSSLFQTIGGALVGATAITFALVMFAMQINVEKMPYGLFRRLSSDVRLLSAYLLSFLLAACVIALSLIQDSDWIPSAVFLVFLATVFILGLFLYAYCRALDLINPVSQLKILVKDTVRNLNKWDSMASMLSPPSEDRLNNKAHGRAQHDNFRIEYFSKNSYWTNELKQAISHTVFYSRRYSEIDDHEVSSQALSSLVDLNKAYIKAKGKTFISDHPIFPNSMTHDGIVTETLEHLRQNIQRGLVRGDEQQIEQNMQTVSLLVYEYLNIDYGSQYASRIDAHIALEYLTSAVQSVAPHKMVDVVMMGTKLLKNNAHQILEIEGANEIQSAVKCISTLAFLGIFDAKFFAVTITSIDALASLTLGLIQSKNRDIHYAAKIINNQILMLAELVLETPETTSFKHRVLLGPYYSGSSFNTLLAGLIIYGNVVVDADEDNAEAKQLALNICRWAYKLHVTEERLLQKAAQVQSSLAIDNIHWITKVTEILLAVANSPACDAHTASELRKHAWSLISSLKLIPDDKVVISFLENYRMTETLFKAARDSLNKNCEEIEETTRRLLRDWIFKSAKHELDRKTLGHGLLGLATLAVLAGGEEALKTEVERRLSKPDSPSLKCRAQAADLIRKFVHSPNGQCFHSGIERAAEQSNQEKLSPRLTYLAEKLSPTEQPAP